MLKYLILESVGNVKISINLFFFRFAGYTGIIYL
jgi:hypothetical protein